MQPPPRLTLGPAKEAAPISPTDPMGNCRYKMALGAFADDPRPSQLYTWPRHPPPGIPPWGEDGKFAPDKVVHERHFPPPGTVCRLKRCSSRTCAADVSLSRQTIRMATGSAVAFFEVISPLRSGLSAWPSGESLRASALGCGVSDWLYPTHPDSEDGSDQCTANVSPVPALLGPFDMLLWGSCWGLGTPLSHKISRQLAVHSVLKKTSAMRGGGGGGEGR